MKPTILACPPVEKKKQLLMGIVGFSVSPGAIEGVCALCGWKVWIGSKQQELMKTTTTEVVCFNCAARTGGQVKHLGGAGGSYLVNGIQFKNLAKEVGKG